MTKIIWDSTHLKRTVSMWWVILPIRHHSGREAP